MSLAPLFHANGWYFPYVATMTGSKLGLPGRNFEAHRRHKRLLSELALQPRAPARRQLDSPDAIATPEFRAMRSWYQFAPRVCSSTQVIVPVQARSVS
jgi:hypothetical protein